LIVAGLFDNLEMPSELRRWYNG